MFHRHQIEEFGGTPPSPADDYPFGAEYQPEPIPTLLKSSTSGANRWRSGHCRTAMLGR